ncbi:hypothetical protein QBC35DRAFT_479397 [Podospora australis]|uniref:HIT domain-containing protein n=1 Tax=Podospora australis TaxID=1536484 RepID=A0AAN6WHS4_9PEZI|nr:hypothetical protein QBC35DRAFT_479397 [Podospora australis]
MSKLEAGIVDGASAGYGAVACTEATKNPVAVANALLEQGPHVMLVGRFADEANKNFGFEVVTNDHFTTPYRKAYWDQTAAALGQRDSGSEMGTVGAIVLDEHGNLAAGASTGGPTGKVDGRIGDTAVLGAGLSADSKLAVLCSGAGDQIFKHLVAANVAKYHVTGSSIRDAARKALQSISATGASCAMAVIDAEGNAAIESTAKLFSVSWAPASGPSTTGLLPTSFPILPTHTIHQCLRNRITVDRALWGGALCSCHGRRRCLSILPLHGLSKEWHPVTSKEKEFHEEYPGYISSNDGPMMAAEKLDGISSRIRAVSGLTAPFNNRFNGPDEDSKLFARIIRGELGQWRIWEDDHHVAFLTPFANTPGFTVLVPRKHLPSDIFAIKGEEFSALMESAHSVGNLLRQALGTSRCGMIFEGFEIDHAHVKLIPIHRHSEATGTTVTVAPFNHHYQGSVTSLNGPLLKGTASLTLDAAELRKKIPVKTITSPRSWADPPRHLSAVLQEPWYKSLFTIQDALFHDSIAFFQKQLGYKYRAAVIQAVAGTTAHLKSLLELHRSSGGKFPRVTVDDALKLVVMNSNDWRYVVESDTSKGRTLTRDGELKLIQHFGGAVWVTEMDHLSVPFYQAFIDDTQAKARCGDLLLGNGEVLGAGERHVEVKDMLAALEQHQVPAQGYPWYTEIREHKPLLTTGWGMGIERFVAWVFQHNDIRNMTIIPRMKGISFAP